MTTLCALAASAMIHSMTSDIQSIVDSVVKDALTTYESKNLKPDELGISISRLDRVDKSSTSGQYRADDPMYPASVVKAFYLGYAAHLLDQKKLTLSTEFERGIHDMVVDSNNDATGLVLDTITDTTGGPELPPAEFKAWREKRNAVNRWYESLGYRGLNASNKTWNEGPYGRERQGYGPNYEWRNSLTPNVCRRLFEDMAFDRLTSKSACDMMRKYLHRVVPADGKADSQARLFSGKVLPKGTTLYSKAGWVDSERHDVAYVVLPNGHEYVWAIFTKKHGGDGSLIPYIVEKLLQGLGELG